ncbi:hypothetical protein HDU67_000653 [Dinochytrium kinnereticum]|nr:hypothetical protein HDU67_000653 [Dinochytrium kinnereticum]
MTMEKAILDARRDAVAALENEIAKAKEREEAQIAADRSVLEKESHLLSLRRWEIHREAAHVRAERLGIDAAKARTVAEAEAFERARDLAEREVRQTVDIHDKVVRERQQAEAFNLEAKKVMAEIEEARARVKVESEEVRHHELHHDFSQTLSDNHSNLIQLLIRLAFTICDIIHNFYHMTSSKINAPPSIA